MSAARRVGVGLGAATIGAAAALAGDPFGTYLPEQHLVAIGLGAALGGTAGALLPSLAELDRPLRTGLEVVSSLLIALLAHPAGIAMAFSLAADRRVLIGGLLLGLVSGGAALFQRFGWLEIAVLLAAPLVAVTAVHHATFLRSPGIDCATVAQQPGVTAWSVFPDHVDPALHGALVYDVVANREWTAAAFVKQRGEAGCGAVVVWDQLGNHLLIDEEFRSERPDAEPLDGCWMTARLVLEGDRLIVPLSSYDGSLRPRLVMYDLSSGPAATLAHSVDLPVDPADVALHNGRLFVLSYPRRFAGDGASAVAMMDPLTADTLHVERFEPDGWMTEYLVPSGGALFVTDVFGHLYELDANTLVLRREVRPGASMLGGAAAGERLFVAAPYKQEAWVLDRSSLEVLARLPGGDALRDLEVDHARQRLYGIGYGDGRLYGWSLEDAGRSLGSLHVGRPLRGMAFHSQRIWTAGGCGVFEVDSDALEAR